MYIDMSLYATNFIGNQQSDLGNLIFNKTTATLNFPTDSTTINKQQITYPAPMIIRESDIAGSIDGFASNGDQIISFGPNMQNVIQVFNAGYFGYSTDGIIYYPKVAFSYSSTPSWNSIKYNGNMWLAVINNNTTNNIGYSYDGINWSFYTNSASTSGFNALCWTGTMWILGASTTSSTANASIFYSYDGLNWQSVPSSSTLISFIYTIKTNGNIIWAVGRLYANSVYTSAAIYSYDGITWQAPPILFSATGSSSLPALYVANIIYDILWTGKLWIASGGSGVSYSTDPLGLSNWKFSITSANGYGNINSFALAWNGQVCVVSIQQGPSMHYSYDGINWTSNTRNFASSVTATSTKWNGTLFASAGYSAVGYSYNPAANWPYGVSSVYVNGRLFSMNTGGAVNGNGYIFETNMRRNNLIAFPKRLSVAGGIGTSSTLFYSYDGINWQPTNNTVFTTAGNASAYNGRRWVAAGQGGNTLAYSQNGIKWNGSGSAVFSTAGLSVVWSPALSMFIAGGQGTNTLAISYDGLTWIPKSNSIFLTSCNAISTSANLIVAVGQGGNTIAYSTNGISWQSAGIPVITTKGTGITNNGSLWVAVGNTATAGKIAYSYNGANWTDTGFSGFYTSANSIAWNGTLWVAGGQGGNTTAYSYDGINWNAGTNPVLSTGNAISWNGTVWTAGGTNGNIVYSYDGITWNKYVATSSVYSWSQTSAPKYNWQGIAMSDDGTKIYGCVYNSFIYISTDSGASWSQSSSPNLVWTGICCSSDGTKVYASNTTDSNVYISTNSGSTWVAKAVIGALTTISCSASGNVIATGARYNSSTVYVSTNSGSTWTNNAPLSWGFWDTRVSRDGNVIAASQNGYGQIYTSSNGGVSWVETTGIYQTFTISGNGSQIIGFNQFNMTISSGNGISTNGGATFSVLNQLIYNFVMSSHNGSVVVGYGGNNTLVFSTNNGATFRQINGLSENWSCGAISQDGTKIVIAASNDYIWTGSVIAYNNTFSQINNIATNYQVSPKPYIQPPTLAFSRGVNPMSYSPDGLNWQSIGQGIFSGQGNRAFWNGSIWIAAGIGGNSLAYSYDGFNWTGLGSNILTNATGITYNGSVWVAVGEGPSASISYSQTGFSWTPVSNSSQIFTAPTGNVSWNGTAFVAGGNTIATSPNGVNWQAVSNTVLTSISSIANNGTMWIAVGKGTTNQISYTLDTTGKTGWTQANTSPFSIAAYDIAWNGQIWVSTGSDTANTIATSIDGINWTGILISNSSGGGICWNGIRWILTPYNGGNIYYSFDAANWYSPKSYSLGPNSTGVSSNSGVGAFVAPSALVLSNTGISGNNITCSQTLDFISSDEYYQQGFSTASITVNPVYNPAITAYMPKPIYVPCYYFATGNYLASVINNYNIISFLSGAATIQFTSARTAYVIIVGGGGGGGFSLSDEGSGGGGAGAIGYGTLSFTAYSKYNISVGLGGIGGIANSGTPSTNGTNTTISGLGILETVLGGGGGGSGIDISEISNGNSGGSGGGGNGNRVDHNGGSVNSSSGTLTYIGNIGGTGYTTSYDGIGGMGGGGGGATSVGGGGTYSSSSGGGGNGYVWSYTNATYGGGGGGGASDLIGYMDGGSGGSGGGGNGGTYTIGPADGSPAIANTGGGGGGGTGGGGNGGAGGSGVVIIAF